MLEEHETHIDILCNVCGTLITTISHDEVPYFGPQTHERCRDPSHEEDR
jgi:C4-type Zn-finger protein